MTFYSYMHEKVEEDTRKLKKKTTTKKARIRVFKGEDKLY